MIIPKQRRQALLLVGLLLLISIASSFSFSLPWNKKSPATATRPHTGPSDDDPTMDQQKLLAETKSVVSTVAVTGATGRTGRLVVQQLLDRGVSQVLALVRDEEKAKQVFSNNPLPKNLKIIPCDLSKEADILKALEPADAAIWCATGFSDAPGTDPLEKVKRLLGIALTPKSSIDAVGLPALAKALAQNKERINGSAPAVGATTPKIVMCSSAGVTRPIWDADKRERFIGSADIPIVRLNPFGILDVKRESETKLRETCRAAGINYCIVRPTGLNDNWPAGSRPVLSQGDVAVGRTNRQDVAKLLVDVLSATEASGKTFEAFTVAGYAPAVSIRPALARLSTDQEGLPSDEEVAATYHTLQQLLPGEQQDSAALAMGQTYEQLDKGETGRLGKRGEEEVAIAKAEIAGTRS